MNHYRFKCPIKGEDVALTHCEEVHSKSMQGRSQDAPDSLCAVAHLCWMCPARNGFRVGGPWSKPETKPHWPEPRETTDRLPKDLEAYALSHVPPNDADYRRAGLWGEDVGCYDDLLRGLHDRTIARGGSFKRPGVHGAPKQNKRVAPAASKPPAPQKRSKVETATDALAAQNTNEFAETVNEIMAQEKSKAGSETRVETQERTPAPDAHKTKRTHSSALSEGSADKPAGKLSFAERARLMKQRKEKA